MPISKLDALSKWHDIHTLIISSLFFNILKSSKVLQSHFKLFFEISITLTLSGIMSGSILSISLFVRIRLVRFLKCLARLLMSWFESSCIPLIWNFCNVWNTSVKAKSSIIRSHLVIRLQVYLSCHQFNEISNYGNKLCRL